MTCGGYALVGRASAGQTALHRGPASDEALGQVDAGRHRRDLRRVLRAH